MSLIKNRTRRATIGATVVALAMAGGGAFAYFTTSGEGTGEAKVENPTAKLEVTSLPVEQLAPGISKADKVTIKNTAEGPERVSVLKAKITGNSKSGTGCETTWFKVSPETTSFGATGVELAAGATQTAEVTVSMINAEVSQNACKGATVNLHFEAE
ncbi:MAG TPA: hypothetical protein VKU89_10525 [Solirubrobacteraceae bacterium]|nr:hypothetical protein [Solirubrobacteraceae bacterium]